MKYNFWVRIWLITGCVMLFLQIFIGGVTRITGSGLSITKWEIVTGTIPPLNEKQWKQEFEKYKETPQFEKINRDMDLAGFKFIYFWEYLHRLWARLMGFVFLLPLLFFIYKKWIDRELIKRLVWVILAAALAAIFGWIMVASGLVNRPWVNAYKLSLHLGIALLTYALLIWTTLFAFSGTGNFIRDSFYAKAWKYFLVALCVQIFFGAIVSGMRASLYYPTWPDMHGYFIPPVLMEAEAWHWRNIIEYDKDTFMPALIHVLHRNWGYLVYLAGMILAVRMIISGIGIRLKRAALILVGLLNLQVILGVLILLNSESTIPVFYGVMHQSIAIFMLTVILFLNYYIRNEAVYE